MDAAYRRHYRELYERHWWWRVREEIICDELRKRLQGHLPVRILDVGCGDGLFFNRLREFGDVEGIESEADLVDPDGPHCNRITVAPFNPAFQPQKKYGLILMLDVLEHLDAPHEALRHAMSLLEPNGILVATVPAFLLLWTNHDELNQHRTRFTKKSFGALAESAGVDIVAMRYLFAWMFPAKLATRMTEAIIGTKPSVPRIPPAPLNRTLFWASRAEEKLTRNLSIPFGNSLLAIAQQRRKPC